MKARRYRTEGGNLGGASQRGLTLLEVIVASLILSVALVGLIAALVSELRLRQVNKEKALARNGAERTLSAIRGMNDLLAAYARFGGGGPQETFEVQGLAPPAPGTPVGRVFVWRLKGGNPPDPGSTLPLPAEDLQELRTRMGTAFPIPITGRETAGGADFLDTNSDGAVTAADQPSLMPVTVRIRWRSHSGIVTEYFNTIVGDR